MKREIKVALLTLATVFLVVRIVGYGMLSVIVSSASAAALAAYGGWRAVTRWLPARLERDAWPAHLSTDRPSWVLVAGPVVFAAVVTIAAEVLQAKGLGKFLQAWGLAFALVYNYLVQSQGRLETGELPHIRINNSIRVRPKDLQTFIASTDDPR